MAKRKPQVRRIEERDLPGIVALYRTMGAATAKRPVEEVTAKLRALLIQQPHFGPGDPHAVVHVSERDGAVVGFLGSVPRLWRVGAREVIGTSATAFVVDAEHPDRLVSALWLGRASFGRQHDFAFTDRPTLKVAGMFETIHGAVTLPGLGYNFRLPLRRRVAARELLHARFGRRRWWPVVAPADRLARHVTWTLDAVRPDPLPEPSERELELEPIDAASLTEARLALAEHYTACLVDNEALAAWQIQYMADYPSRGRYRWSLCRDQGRAVGWFLYYVRKGEASELTSIAAIPSHRAAVVAACVRAAFDDGCTALVGTSCAVMAHDLLDAGAAIVGADRFVLMCRDPELLAAFDSSKILLTGLEGEVFV